MQLPLQYARNLSEGERKTFRGAWKENGQGQASTELAFDQPGTFYLSLPCGRAAFRHSACQRQSLRLRSQAGHRPVTDRWWPFPL